MKKILVFGTFCLLLLSSAAFAEEKIITLGGKEGWPEFSRKRGVTTGSGRFGWDCMELATNSREADEYTDLLIDFEDPSFTDAMGNYTTTVNEFLTAPEGIRGKTAGLSSGDGGLRLKGKPGTFFGTTGNAGSFTIEFWLKPSIAENGEIVFSWMSSRTISGYALYQMITASFFNNHLKWNFKNLFSGYTDNNGEVSLTSYRAIIPEEWCHHAITYDDESGLLEYRINGQIEALTYVTTNGKERGGSIYNLQFGVTAEIDICPQFTGSIDDFRIERQAIDFASEGLSRDKYKSEGGRFETMPVLVSNGASLTALETLTSVPEQTALLFYVRSGDNFFNWDENYPEWIPVTAGEKITGVKGLYFQVAADLLTDGEGSKSPSVTEIKLHFEEAPLPLPPFTVQAEPGDGKVTLSWSYSVDDSTGGYFVYYGERPGEYLGRTAVQGSSPVNAGNTNHITLTGLTNGKIYYFAIASYSRIDISIQGMLSNEVYARPLKR